jgi:hypothetical protein
MAEGQVAPRFIGCEMGDGNTADIVLVNLYTGDSHICCIMHAAELMDAGIRAILAPDDPDVIRAMEQAGDMTQAPVTGSVGFIHTDGSLSTLNELDEFDMDDDAFEISDE